MKRSEEKALTFVQGSWCLKWALKNGQDLIFNKRERRKTFEAKVTELQVHLRQCGFLAWLLPRTDKDKSDRLKNGQARQLCTPVKEFRFYLVSNEKPLGSF